MLTCPKQYIYLYPLVHQSLVDAVLAEHKTVHQDSFYDIDRSRETMAKALSATRTYHLRIPDIDKSKITTTQSTKDVLEFRNTSLWPKFPAIHNLLSYLVDKHNLKTVGRAFVTKLEQNSSIATHVDEGKYFDALHRFHLVLDSSEGAVFGWQLKDYGCEKQAKFSVGDLVVINNSVPHYVVNNGPPRTHLIFDAA